MRVKNQAMNITEVEYNGQNEIVIAHGVNCQGVMGAGVAKALYCRWPIVKEQYQTLPKRARKLGRIQPIGAEQGITVFNCFTQENYGSDGQRYANPETIGACIRKVLDYMVQMEMRKPTLYIPRIGAGLGGLDWKEDVCPQLKSLGRDYPDAFTLVICTL